MPILPDHRPTVALSRNFLRIAFACAGLLVARPAADAAAITSGTRYPSNEEQYTLQLINRARASADGITILKGFVTNNVGAITASSTGTASDGTAWSSGFWTSNIPGVADSMNFFQVHPGDLKRQFLDLSIPGTPLAWHPNLGNVAAGYNDIVIANQGAGPGFPHSLSPYQDQSTFAAYAKRYTDGGYGPLNTINALAENIAPNFFTSAQATFAGFMIDWGYSANGIQSQDPQFGSHRLSLMAGDLLEIGISRKAGWGASNITEVQEFGRRFSPVPALVGAVYTDTDANNFYTPGEGLAQVTVTAAPVGGGTSFQTTTFGSGGYTLPVSTAGNYTVTFTNTAGLLKTATVTIGTDNVALDAQVTAPVVDPPPTPTSKLASDLNGDDHPDYVLFFSSTRRTEVWYLNGATKTSQATGPTLNSGWKLVGVADFNKDGHPDYLLYNSSTRKTEVWYLNGVTKIGTAAGPTLTSGWTVVGLEDFNLDGKVDLLLYKSATRQTMVWYLDGVTLLPGNPAGPTLPASTTVAGVGDFNADGKPDLLLFTSTTRKTTVYYLNGATKTGQATGPTLASGWVVSGVADIDGDTRPDLVTYASSGRKTQIRYLGGVTETGSATGPVLTSGSTLVSP